MTMAKINLHCIFNSILSQGSFTNRRFTYKLSKKVWKARLEKEWKLVGQELSNSEKCLYKQSGTFSIEISTENLFENIGNRITSYSDRQYNSPDVVTNGLFFQRNLETSIKEKRNSTVLFQCTEQAHKLLLHSSSRKK